MLTYETGTLYRDNSVTLQFDVEALFQWAVELDEKPKRSDINAKIAEIMDVKPSRYQLFSELTESDEFHAAADKNGHVNVLELKKDKKKDSPNRQGPRGSNAGLTNADKIALAKSVVSKLEGMSSVNEDPGKDYAPTLEWTTAGLDKVFKAASKVKIDARPEVVKTDAAKLANVNEKIANAIKTAAGKGLDAEAIVDALMGVVDANTVNAVLESIDNE